MRKYLIFALFGIFVCAIVLTVVVLQERQGLRQFAAEGNTNFTVELALHGLGKAGDNANPDKGGNTQPLRTQKSISIDAINSQNNLVATKQGTVTYDSANGTFKGTIDMGTTIPDGAYTIKIKSDQYLKTLVPGIQTIVANTTNTLPKTSLSTGDINNDNTVNILDYTILIGCFSELKPATNCIAANKSSADITDDGNVNSFDYNLFLRELTNRIGAGGVSTGTTPPTSTSNPTIIPTSTPTKTPTPTPSQTSTNFPNAANTGYPQGLPGDTRTRVTLTPYTGPCTITVAGTVIDGKDITCNLTINAKNVIIRNSRIRVENIQAITSTSDSNNLLVEDTEVDGLEKDNSTGGIALIGRTGYTLRRVNAHSSGDITRVDGWAEIYDSWLHNPQCIKDSCHNDIIQSTNAIHIRIVHNFLENQHSQTSCILLKADLGDIDDVVVNNNLFNGGGITFYWYDAKDVNTGVWHHALRGAFTNNRFMRAPTGGYYANGGYWKPTEVKYQPGFSHADTTWTNNVWDDTGQQIQLNVLYY